MQALSDGGSNASFSLRTSFLADSSSLTSIPSSNDGIAGSSNNDAQRRRSSTMSLLEEDIPLAGTQIAHPAITSTRLSSEEIMKGLSINKLNFDSVDLYGRDIQLKQLQDIRDGLLVSKLSTDTDSSNGTGKVALAIVEGLSGTGKTRLVSSFTKRVKEKRYQDHEFFYMEGKFDLKHIEIPFDGFIMAVNSLCKGIVGDTEEIQTKIRDKLKKELEKELSFLIQIFPQLVTIVTDDDTISESTTTSDGANVAIDLKGNAERLKHCVRCLLQVIGSFRPIIMFYDDTHWADKPSLDLIYQIITDPSSKASIFVIQAYRSDLVTKHDDHVVTNFIRDVETAGSIPVRKVQVNDLTVHDINKFLMDLLSADAESDKTSSLANVLHRKTGGNIFFVIQLLLVLQQRKMITYNLGMLKWTWDVEEIQKGVPSTDNVVDLVKNKLERDDVAKVILPQAACLGFSFESSTLSVLILDPSGQLQHCENEGYIQRTGDDTYQFIHDRIQEVALSLGGQEGSTETFKRHVGKVLSTTLPLERQERLIFTIVGLIDGGSKEQNRISNNCDGDERMELVRVNFTAGKKAMSCSAFEMASTYFGRAISLLPNDSWMSNYPLTLDLYSAASEAEFCCGHIQATETYCNAIRIRETVPATDKLRASHVLMDSYVARGKSLEAIQLGMDILSSFGYKIPKNDVTVSLTAATGLVRLKYAKRLQDSATIAALPVTTDPIKTGVMKTLDKMATATFIAKPALLPVVILKSIQCTIQDGITIYSPCAFASLALLLTNFMNDFEVGWKFGQHALEMLKRLKYGRQVAARTIFLVYSYTYNWSHPLRSTLNPHLEAYRIGLGTGDVQSACYALLFYCEHGLYSGVPLVVVENNSKTYSAQMLDLGQTHTLYPMKMVHQLVQNLIGEGGQDSTILTGDTMNEEETLDKFREDGDEFYESTIYRYRIILSSYIGDYNVGAELALKWSEKNIKLLPGQSAVMMLRFCSAICYLDVARRTKQKKYLKEAKRLHKIIKGWSERRKAHNPNCMHHEVLLSAEVDALNGKTMSAYKKFEAAALMAGRRGITHDHALANERFGRFCAENNDRQEALFRYKEAIRLYEEWGARNKVERVRSTLSSIESLVGMEISI